MKTPIDQSVCEDTVFQNIFQSSGDAVYRFAYYKCLRQDEAEDLVQEAFVRLWENCAKVPIAKAKAFLITVVRNLFLKQVDHQKVVKKHQQSQPSQKIDVQSPEFLLEEKEFGASLQAIINELPGNERQVFLLNRVEGKKYREIAEMLGISQKTVEKRMRLALKKIRLFYKKV